MTAAVERLRAIAQVLNLCQDCEAKVITGESRQPQRAEEAIILDLPIPDLLEHRRVYESESDRGRSDTRRSDTPVPVPVPVPVRQRTPGLLQSTPDLGVDEASPPPPSLPPNDIFYKRCFVNVLRAVDCDFQAFTVKDCDLEGVTFRNCNFSNVVFEDIKLKNVTFVNVDFRNVWLRDINWICALWDGVGLANAFVTGYSFRRNLEDEKRPRLVLPLKTWPTSTFSKTKILYPLRARSAKAEQDGESKIVCQETEEGLLHFPDRVMDAILSHLFPRSHDQNAHAIMVSDLPTSLLDTSSSQTNYTIRSPFGFRSASFTYHGWPCASAHAATNVDQQQDDFRLNFCLPFLLVSKRCYELAIPHIYNRRLHFDDKPERCIAFVKDHQEQEHKLLAITLRYSSQTDPAAWCQLFETLLADKDAISELSVEISNEFWSSSVWRGKCWPETLISWRGWTGAWQQQLSEPPKELEKSFMERVARLPGSRLNRGKVARKAEDVRFFFDIQGAKGFPSREAFVDEVQLKLRMRMLGVAEK